MNFTSSKRTKYLLNTKKVFDIGLYSFSRKLKKKICPSYVKKIINCKDR